MMDTHHLLLLLLTMMMMMMPVSVLASKSPFRGELNAVPRGLDVLLGNVASQTSSSTRRGSGNDLVDRRTAGVSSTTTPSSGREASTASQNHSPEGDIVVRLHETVLVADNSAVNSLPIRIQLTFNVTGSDSDVTMTSVTLNLERNDRVKPTAVVVIGDGEGSVVPSEVDYPNRFAFYYDIDNLASVKVERRHSRLYYSGRFHIGRYVYRFDPVELRADDRGRSRSRRSSDADHQPVQYTVSATLLQHDPHSQHEPGVRLPDAQFIPYMSERSDGDDGSGKLQYIVEILAVIDHRIFQRFYRFSPLTTADAKRRDAINNIRFYYAHVFNGVDMRYRSINDSTFSIAVQLNGYYIATNANASRFIEDHWNNGSRYGINANAVLTHFASWLLERRGQLPDHDQATLFTSESLLGSTKNYISGLSVVSGICSSYSVTVCKDSGHYHVTETAAHELGHNLGAGHDGIDNTCSFDDQYIMAAYSIQLRDSNFLNAFTFSPCSISEFRVFLGRLATSARLVDRCLLTLSSRPINMTFDLGELPGQRYTPDQQCQLIYGQRSYYCGGRDEDMKLCRYMECFHPVWRYCYVHYDQRAFDGTTCRNHSMCIDGSCVVDSKAPSAPNDCVYGDYRGPYGSGLSCSSIGTTALWNCYNKYYYDDCCVTCLQRRNNSAPGCEYGDRDPNCVTLERAQCYNDTFRNRCCATCGRLLNASAVGCEYGDRSTWCPKYVTSSRDCYNEGATCCQSCEPYRLNMTGCEYGDRATWCTTLRPSSCYANSDQCCQFCARYFDPSQVGCEYGDRSNWCDVIDSHQCYRLQRTCCHSCKQFYTSVAGCEYGDRVAGCTLEDCSNPARNLTCCATCNPHYSFRPSSSSSTTHSPPPSTSVTSLSVSSSRTSMTPVLPSSSSTFFSTSSTSLTSTTISTTSSSSSWSLPSAVSSWSTSSSTSTTSTALTSSTWTSHSSTTTHTRVPCPTEFQPKWCVQIKPSNCYTVSEICCDECAKHVYNRQSINCYYGDHYTWCSERYCGIPSLRTACCATCKQPTTTTTTLPTTTPPVKLKCYGGDKATYCHTMPQRDCYVLASVCCDTCSAYFQHSDTGCEYGDRVGWCRQYIRSEAECRQPSVAAYCCQTCQAKYGVKCGDSVPWCSTIHPSHCYSNSVELSFCCRTCKTFRTGDIAGCEYGNQYSWCDGMPQVFCQQYKSFCCKRCGV